MATLLKNLRAAKPSASSSQKLTNSSSQSHSQSHSQSTSVRKRVVNTHPVPTMSSPRPIPIVQVLPFSSRTESLIPSDLTKHNFPDGLLAWGNLNTAIKIGTHFDVVIVTAEEFPLDDTEFMQQVVAPKHVKVFHVPISEIGRGNFVREENYIHQPVIHITAENGVIQRKNAIIRTGTVDVKSDELIYFFLNARKRVLVVCMAGKNRSTATLIRFLLLLSLRIPGPKESDLLVAARHPGWCKEDWEKYLARKREFEIFPLNDAQLKHLDETLSSLRSNARKNACGLSKPPTQTEVKRTRKITLA